MDSQETDEVISDQGPKWRTYFCASTFQVPHMDDLKEQCTSEKKIVEWAGVSIARISPTVAVKFGPRVTVTEAKSMIYVAQNSAKIPVPEVFACGTYGPINRDIGDYGSLFDTYIFMTFVDGQPLDTVWNSYDQPTKTHLALQLKEYIDDLRSMGTPSYIGSLDHGPVLDPILATAKVQGPFSSEKDFNETMVKTYQSKAPRQHITKFLRGMIGHQEHRILFTHGDLGPQNIMVKDGNVTGIIDWEFSGWYPEYWESAKALNVWRWQNDWGDYLIDILQPYYPEYAFYSFLSKVLW
ncbi:kinase-like protein [Aspergillus coremiiformis]|uniref:Kinase-like protein n=1 Tax=Aspergillus coremiiformis TaxID=138285 RepID=A0A5N6Z0B3_9EURO|nr:kinase-like protein [Aspergillus coremiiformis]